MAERKCCSKRDLYAGGVAFLVYAVMFYGYGISILYWKNDIPASDRSWRRNDVESETTEAPEWSDHSARAGNVSDLHNVTTVSPVPSGDQDEKTKTRFVSLMLRVGTVVLDLVSLVLLWVLSNYYRYSCPLLARCLPLVAGVLGVSGEVVLYLHGIYFEDAGDLFSQFFSVAGALATVVAGVVLFVALTSDGAWRVREEEQNEWHRPRRVVGLRRVPYKYNLAAHHQGPEARASSCPLNTDQTASGNRLPAIAEENSATDSALPPGHLGHREPSPRPVTIPSHNPDSETDDSPLLQPIKV